MFMGVCKIVAGSSSATIGILGLQGDSQLHQKKLEHLGVKTKIVRLPSQLAGLKGLIIPGGESTALLKLAEPIGMLSAIVDFSESGNSILATCAGTILLARKVSDPPQYSLKLIDIDVARNAYGRQLQSVESHGFVKKPLKNGTLEMVFIRAPKITRLGKGVKVLAEYENNPVLVEQGNIIAATFHPELTNDNTIYSYWFNKIR